MGYNVTLSPNECLKMEPLVLFETLKKDLVFDIPENVNSSTNQRIAAATITKATAYASYFTEMETRAKLMKKAAKAAKDTEEYNRLMSIEDVFKALKDVSKMQIENVAKLMTLKRLELDEQRQNYNNHIT